MSLTSVQVKPVVNGPLIGGETEALNRLKKFAAECQTHPPKETNDGNNDSVYGASFSCKISPWLALGCISPRAVFDELKNSASRYARVFTIFFYIYLFRDKSIMYVKFTQVFN
ncbi:putative cryptochrome/DNA photolyase, FAD-binding domain-like superfamily [Helianthus annuus]|nr:putative cryptochrome/DNA photolyase, FAD-binding domain-like superfamily [Helianthus annuus]